MSSPTTPNSILERDHPEWEARRLGWNLAADQRPSAIAEPKTVEDVIAAVNYARAAGYAGCAAGHRSRLVRAGGR